MDDFELMLEFDAAPETVYAAIGSHEGPAAWWTRFAQMGEGVGALHDFQFPGAGFFAKMKVVAMEPPVLVEWECVDSRHPPETGWSDLSDWVGTSLRFEITPSEHGGTLLHFTHIGLNPALECYAECESGWIYYLGQSLKEYVETGIGRPYDQTEAVVR